MVQILYKITVYDHSILRRHGSQVMRKMVSKGYLLNLPSVAAPRARSLHVEGADDNPTKTIKDGKYF